MKKRPFLFGMFLGLGGAALAGAWYGMPQRVLPSLLQANRRWAGAAAQVVHAGAHRVHYLERGQGPVVLLLHGIFGEKDHWVDFVRAMPPGCRLIAPDLPGFGDTGRNELASYDYASQMRYLLAFMDGLGLERVHVAGSSMGGTLGAVLAQQHPHRVRSLAFIGAPHGLRTAQPSDMDRAIDAGRAPLVPRNEAEFDAMLALVFARRPFLPYPVLQQARERALAQQVSNRRVWDEQLADRFLLDSVLGQLQTPLFALWGGQDRVFHVSGVERLRQLVPDAHVHRLNDAGHLPMMENPVASAQAYADFLKFQQK